MMIADDTARLNRHSQMPLGADTTCSQLQQLHVTLHEQILKLSSLDDKLRHCHMNLMSILLQMPAFTSRMSVFYSRATTLATASRLDRAPPAYSFCSRGVSPPIRLCMSAVITSALHMYGIGQPAHAHDSSERLRNCYSKLIVSR